MKSIIFGFLFLFVIKFNVCIAKKAEHILVCFYYESPFQSQENKYSKESYIFAKNSDNEFIYLDGYLEDYIFHMTQETPLRENCKKTIEKNYPNKNVFLTSHKAYEVSSKVIYHKIKEKTHKKDLNSFFIIQNSNQTPHFDKYHSHTTKSEKLSNGPIFIDFLEEKLENIPILYFSKEVFTDDNTIVTHPENSLFIFFLEPMFEFSKDKDEPHGNLETIVIKNFEQTKKVLSKLMTLKAEKILILDFPQSNSTVSQIQSYNQKFYIRLNEHIKSLNQGSKTNSLQIEKIDSLIMKDPLIYKQALTIEGHCLFANHILLYLKKTKLLSEHHVKDINNQSCQFKLH